MFKRLFLGNTNIDFHNIGSRFYKIFIIEFIIFSAVLIGSIFGFLNLNLSVDFTGGTTYQLDTEYTDNDIVFNTCLEIYNIEKDPSMKMERLYSLYHKDISNTILKKFIFSISMT